MNPYLSIVPAFVLTALWTAGTAHADDTPPAPQAPPAATPTAPAAPAPSLPVAPTRSVAITVPGGYVCTLGEHSGVEESDGRTAVDLVCHELARQKATAGAYEVRFGKLGSRTLVSISDPAGFEQRTFVQSVEEIPTVAPRLVEAVVQHKSFDQTVTANNVIGSETRVPRVKPGQSGAYLGVIGMSGIGMSPSMSGGFDMGIIFRSDRVAFTLHGRAGGIGSADDKLGFADLDLGGRYYLGDGDVAPFVSGGFEFAYFQANRRGTYSYNYGGKSYSVERDSDQSGSGVGAFGEFGLDIGRTDRVGFTLSLRADAPFFTLKGDGDDRYVLPVSLNAGLSFH